MLGQRCTARNEAATASARFDALTAAEHEDLTLSAPELDHAAALVQHGLDAGEAVRQAVRQAVDATTRATLDRDAQMRGAMDLSGLPPSARQTAFPLPSPREAARPVEPAAPGTTTERYGAARADWRDYRSTFGDKTPAGRVLARGPFGGGHAVADEHVAAQFFNRGKNAAGDVQNFIDTVGSLAEARDALADYAAADLRAKAAPDGTVNVPRWRKWIADHGAALDALGLRDKFSSPAAAAERQAKVRAQRAALDRQFAEALGGSNDTVMSRYWRAGPAGADAIRAYMRETGGTPEAMQALQDHAANELLSRAAKTGELSPAQFQSWRTTHAPALSLVPELAAKFDTAAKAQAEADRLLAEKIGAVHQFERSAARFWVRGDPDTAINRAMARTAGNNPVKSMRELSSMVRGDPAAAAGLRRGVADWVAGKVIRVSRDGVERIDGHALRDLLQRGRAALSAVLKPEQVDVLNRVATDALRDVGPKADVHAAGRFVPDWVKHVGGRTVMRLLTHLIPHAGAVALRLDMGGPVGAALGEGTAMLGEALVANHINSTHALLDRMLLDPDFARAMFQQVGPTPAPGIGTRLARTLMRTGVMVASQPYQQQRRNYAKGGAVFDPLQGLNTMFSQIGKLSNPGQLGKIGSSNMNAGAGVPRMPWLE